MGQDSPAAPPARQRSDSDESTTQWLKSNFPLAGGALLALLTLALAMVFISVEERRLTAEQRLGVQAKLGQVQASIEAQLAKNIGLLHTLTAEVELSNSLENKEFSRLAMRLAEHNPQLANIVVAPELIGLLEYNRSIGKTYIGFDYRSSIEDYVSIKKAIESQDVVIDGPSDFQHGQRLLTLRAPISNASGTWGVVQLAIDYQHLLDQAGLFNALGELEVGISPADRPVSDESIIYGGVESFGEGAVSSYVALPQRQWLISAQPTGGWHIPFSSLQWHWLTAVCLAGMLGYLGHRALLNLQRRSDEIEAANYRAHYDVLTGLSNRYYFTRRLGEIIEQSRREQSDFAVLFMDIDHFKQINDALGQGCGDMLIKTVASLVEKQLPEGASLGRLSSDEFLLLVEFNDPEQGRARQEGAALAEQIRASFAEQLPVAGEWLKVSVSVGCAVLGEDGESFDMLLRHVDLALCKAKADGRDRVEFFNNGMDLEASRKLALQTDLHRAYKQQEFELFYQPIVDLDTGTTRSVECLLRWRKEDGSLVSPAEFIPALVSSGLIVDVGGWVIETACREMARQQQPRSVAVNVSPCQLDSDAIIFLIEGVLADTGLPPELLVLEITEDLIIQDKGWAIERLNRLHRMGIRIALDDFGTGYSSLSYLKMLPVDKLKIDQSFVRDMLTDPEDSAIVTTIISMAGALGLELIAEGVETQQQADQLRQMGCQLVQGYFYQRPQPDLALSLSLGGEIATPVIVEQPVRH